MAVEEGKTVAVLAEKPSVARDIARVLGATKSGDGYLQGNGYVVTWAVGHLVALPQPHEIKPQWRKWDRDLLPMLPEQWPLVVYDKTKDQFETVKKILNSPRVARIVCATDAGREGELIFRYIYERADCEKPFQRLWISSLTPDSIRRGFDQLRPGSEYDALGDAACGRSRADWLVGMNLSRAYSLAYGEELSVGRVQTPTLAMVVERELTIRSFVPEDYYEVVATFQAPGHGEESQYKGTWFRAKAEEQGEASRLPGDGEEAKAIAARAKTGKAQIESVESETQRIPAPLFYDLTELQRHANRLFGFSAQQTLETAQALYERHKLISYPRTDSRHLSLDVAATLPKIVRAVEGPYREKLTPGTGDRPLGRRFVDDSKVSDHHAIIPTASAAGTAKLSAEERKIYDLVCRRLLSAWQPDHILAVTRVVTTITNAAIVDRYRTSGTAVEQVGWKVLEPASDSKSSRRRTAEDTAESPLPSGLADGQAQDVIDAKASKKKTRPPKRFTEATLLTAMETAGKTLDDQELSQAMKESGLGTPATRAAIIETLLKREYIVRNEKNLEATDKGIRLIQVVQPEVKSPAMTGQWEAYLQRIQKGVAQLAPFMDGIEEFVRKAVGKVDSAPVLEAISPPAPRGHSGLAVPIPLAPDLTNGSLQEHLAKAFGYSSFRPNQEAVCQAAIEGQDVVLVMPTGSGKSLCYQLPGLVRGGTTLVISPLIALMEDQVGKLKELGFAVEQIHSGRARQDSRQACIDYLNGKLQFLFIAPERLRVAGFPEMLQKRKPSLIAVDEAHCISQWGHDFRPDYRMLQQHLQALRPAPVLALTATATPVVQRDIAEQLGLKNPARFIHGFRRDNIAIEVVEVTRSARTKLVLAALTDRKHRPAIVYSPSRKQAEELAQDLAAAKMSVAAYHAGLNPERRKLVQQKFLEGKLDVMTATIAFGMGIDKPDVRTVIHTALPGSLEGYYQEIGRAGRDGKPSRAILMHAYADRFTHDFFFERDYPNVVALDAIYGKLSAQPIAKGDLQKKLRIDPEIFDKALEKLWTNAGAVVDVNENVTRGGEQWRDLYRAQGDQKIAQVELMMRYASGHQCRMCSLVRHFGDFADGNKACGLCDFCAPADCTAQQFRPMNKVERAAAFQAISTLKSGSSRSTGKLHSEICSSGSLNRDAFEEVIGSLARAGFVHLQDAVFEKDGKQIPYRTATLTRVGYSAENTPDVELLMRETGGGPKKKRTRRATLGKHTR